MLVTLVGRVTYEDDVAAATTDGDTGTAPISG